MINEDKDMMNLIDSLGYNEKVQLLENITSEASNLNNEQKGRMKANVMKQIRLASFRKSIKVGLLVASVSICVLLSAFTPLGQKTLAAIAEKLYFIPGLGKAEMNDGTDIYILPKPIVYIYNKNTFTISSITKISTTVTITMSGDNYSASNIRIEDEGGNRYNYTSSSQGSGDGWIGVFNYEIPDNIYNFNIVFSEDYSLPAKLVKAESYEDYSIMGPTDLCNNLGLTLVPTFLENEIKFDLIQHPYNDGQISLYGKTDQEGKSHINILINNEDNKAFSIKNPESYMGTLSYFYFTPDNKSSKYTIQVPEVTLKYNLNNKLTLPMPKEGLTEVDQEVNLHGFPLTITQMIREGNLLKVFVDTGYDEDKPENISSITLDMDAMSIDYFRWNLNDQLTTESFEFYINPKDKKIKISFENMYTILKGPWVFEVADDN